MEQDEIHKIDDEISKHKMKAAMKMQKKLEWEE